MKKKTRRTRRIDPIASFKQNQKVEQYVHPDVKRANNPPVGLVTAETDHLNGKKQYEYDPFIDPQLQWAGKKEGTIFDVDTVSLHVHERIDPKTIIEAVMNKEENKQTTLFHYFETKENNPPLRDAIEFYKHDQNWSNRLIAGDSLIVMNSLLEKEKMAGKVQMIYIDPPYGITYGSNFQPFVNKKDVRDGKDEDLTQEPEMIKAFRDTWELGIHSYLSYIRDRLLLAKALLDESGSCFVQISDENLHHVREVMEEVFGTENFVNVIPFRKKTMTMGSKLLEQVADFIIWYAKDIKKIKYNPLFKNKTPEGDFNWRFLEKDNGEVIELNKEQIDNHKLIKESGRIFYVQPLIPSSVNLKRMYDVKWKNNTYKSPKNGWSIDEEGMENLIKKNRIYYYGKSIGYKLYLEDYPVSSTYAFWDDVSWNKFTEKKVYVVQTGTEVIKRCMLMTTNPGDLVLDPTCGSGTTAYVAEHWGRRWITCDTSRVAITLAKQRMMTSLFDYYELAHPTEGISSGFNYNSVPHITIGSVAYNENSSDVILYDQPVISKEKIRVMGPFTVEAVPSQRVTSFDEVEKTAQEPDITIARTGETLRQNDWVDELLATGIRGKAGQKIEFARIETLGGTRWVHAEAETRTGEKAVISFGPQYAPLEQRQVELAIEEAQSLVPKPKLIIFASFQFDPEAGKDIAGLKWPGVTILQIQMNTDLLTNDLKKKRSNSESFWLMGQPDVEIKKHGEKYVVHVNGFDYYNTKTGEIESGDSSKIALWELDTDYDGRSIYPRQVFFPMAGEGEGWDKLAKNLKAIIDEDLIEKYAGSVSIPFKLGQNKRVAIKIIDDRGIESLKIIEVKE